MGRPPRTKYQGKIAGLSGQSQAKRIPASRSGRTTRLSAPARLSSRYPRIIGIRFHLRYPDLPVATRRSYAVCPPISISEICPGPSRETVDQRRQARTLEDAADAARQGTKCLLQAIRT